MVDFNFTEASSGNINYDFEFIITFYIFDVLIGSNNIFNSVWADPTASLVTGRFYVGRQEDLLIVNHKDKQAYVENYFSTTVSGSTNEALSSDDSVDINVTY